MTWLGRWLTAACAFFTVALVLGLVAVWTGDHRVALTAYGLAAPGGFCVFLAWCSELP